MTEGTVPYIGVREAAATLGLKPYQLAYIHKVGLFAEPPRLFGRRLYDPATMERLHEFVRTRPAGGRGRPVEAQGEEGRRAPGA